MINRYLAKKYLLFISVCLCGCSSNQDDLNEYIEQIKKRPGRQIEAIAQINTPKTFAFPEQITRRSPFKPTNKKSTIESNLVPDQARLKQPLEQFSLDSLQFVGTLTDGKIKWGLVSVPDKRIFRVRSGDYMGKNYGQIIKVTDEIIELKETIKRSGKWKKKPVSLQLN